VLLRVSCLRFISPSPLVRFRAVMAGRLMQLPPFPHPPLKSPNRRRTSPRPLRHFPLTPRSALAACDDPPHLSSPAFDNVQANRKAPLHTLPLFPKKPSCSRTFLDGEPPFPKVLFTSILLLLRSPHRRPLFGPGLLFRVLLVWLLVEVAIVDASSQGALFCLAFSAPSRSPY